MLLMFYRPTQNLMMATSTVTTLPSMPQMLIGQSAVAGPPVQCAISSMPVCDYKILSITHGVRQADTSEDEFFVDNEAHHPTNQGSHACKEISS
jgi:hypothetical protein